VNEVAPGLIVDSNTGIDVSLPVAGPGARSYAFLLDWNIRALLALAWYAIGAVVCNGRLSLAPPLTHEAAWFGLVAVPASAIYLLYHVVVEVTLRGSTPGKRLAGVRVVARDGRAASIGALLVRNVFRVVDSLPIFYGVGLLVVAMTREHVRWGDMAAGTLLVYERSPSLIRLPAAMLRSGALDTHGAELVVELLERWGTLEPQARVQLARQLLVRYGADAAAVSDGDEAALRAQLEKLTLPG
jgi:uncharacterized RDD family membrane protein YckC